ncbi:MAG: hypothetical protein GY710_16730 [Desulfobacteraceae bacterium]|nr:hypothetical protein [Desulfobacteraceae bacterium]
MNITCPHCKTKLNIPDDRIPKDKNSSFKCPKCQDKVQVLTSQLNLSAMDPEKKERTKRESMPPPGVSSPGRGQALLCMEDSSEKTKFVAAVQGLGFHVEIPGSISEAFKKMAYQIYPLVLVDELFDQNKGFKAMSIHMNELDMSLRRRICMVLFSNGLPTGDPMSALHSSVNYIVGSDRLDHLEDILSTALTEHQDFYTVYNESMRAAGKA